MQINPEIQHEIKQLSLDIAGEIWTFFMLTVAIILVLLNYSKFESYWYIYIPFIMLSSGVAISSIYKSCTFLTKLNILSLTAALDNVKFKMEDSHENR